MTAWRFCVTSCSSTNNRNAPKPMATQAHGDMPATISIAGPVPDRPDVHMDEPALHVQADAAELLTFCPRVELRRGDVGQIEVDRVAVRVLAVARDLVALLAQHQVVLRVAKPGDDVDRVDVKIRRCR